MKNFLLIVFSTLALTTQAGDLKYPVSEIAEELKKDANAVVREDRTICRILAKDRATIYSLFAVTILNAKGDAWAAKVFGYDKFRKIKDLNAYAYDANGKQIKRLRNSEILDRSAFDGSLFSDNRIKAVDLSQSTYPYTVEFESEMEYKYLYSIDGSVIIPDENVSVQHASYQLNYPKDLKPRFREVNVVEPRKKVEIMADGSESVQWIFENLKAVKLEPMGPYAEDIFPRILAAPNQFEYDGYEGDMSTWEAYGKWNQLLNKGKDGLPEATKQKVRELTKGLTTTEQKARVLYEYLQGKTRYVSIQLGIGGLQPFDATVVDQTGYGDCKALSNYMVALLKEAGVKGYYTTIMAGDDEPQVIVDFPSHQANHVIVAVPNAADTIWLECTSQTNPFGYQGTFTGDRKALMITETGGKMVATTRYTAEQNKQSRTAEVKVELTGDAKAKVKTTYSGIQYENGNLNFILNNQYDDQKKWIQRNTGIPSFDINSFSMTNKKEKIPSAIVNLDLSLRRLATVSGKRLFLTPNLMNRSTFVPEKVESRKTKVVRKMAYLDLDTVYYSLPEEIYPEFLPEPSKISSRFGEYEASYKVDQGKLVYIRRVKMNKGEFPPESYAELIDFYRSINKADNIKIVFLTKT